MEPLEKSIHLTPPSVSGPLNGMRRSKLKNGRDALRSTWRESLRNSVQFRVSGQPEATLQTVQRNSYCLKKHGSMLIFDTRSVTAVHIYLISRLKPIILNTYS